MPAVLVVGESLIDGLVDGDTIVESVGGSPANVAVGLARLGDSVRLLTQFGVDAHGDAIRTQLEADGVTVVNCAAGPTPTSTAIARIEGSGSARYEFDLSWDVDLSAASEVRPVPTIVHSGSLGAALMPGADAVFGLASALAGTSLVSFDPNIRPELLRSRESARARIEAWVGLADVVKASDEDLRWLYPDEVSDLVAERWATNHPTIVVLTRGASGATAWVQGRRIEVASVPVSVVDTVGAGDSFTAALLHDLLALGVRTRADLAAFNGWPAVLDYAAKAAAITVSRRGATLPTSADLGP